MPSFSEVTRIEAAIKNKNSKELEWPLWYCRMRQTVPSARPADLKYWSGIEALVKETMAPRLRRRFIRCGRRSRDVGLGWGLSWKIRKKAPKDCQSFVPRVWPAEESDCYIFKSR